MNTQLKINDLVKVTQSKHERYGEVGQIVEINDTEKGPIYKVRFKDGYIDISDKGIKFIAEHVSGPVW